MTVSKSGTGFIGRVTTSAKTASIQISGFNPITKKSVPLGTTTFKVRNLPKPTVYLGGVEDGGQVTGDSKIFHKYGPDVPLTATFNIISWEVSVAGAPMTVRGSGNQLTPAAMALIKQGKKNTLVTITVKSVGPDKVQRNGTGSFRL